MKFWEEAYQKYQKSDIDFELDKFESPIDEVSGEKFGQALKSDVNKVFEEEVTDEILTDLLWGASSFPMQPFDSKLKSFQAWVGGFVRSAEKTDGTVGGVIKLAHEHLEKSMSNRNKVEDNAN